MSLLLLLVLLLCNSYYTVSLSAEGLALLPVKLLATSNQSAFENWNQLDTDPCHWSGITCSILSKHFPPSVISISLPNQNLSGQIPIQLAFLPNLHRLNLQGNNLSGPLPELLFYNSSALRSILLHDNNLSGPIPLSICNIPHLQNLDMSHNSLSGEIPDNFKYCKNLQRLILAGNELSGRVPVRTWIEMKSLDTLDLSDNELNGSIPDEIGELSSLSGMLNMSSNEFTGNIPESLTKLPTTVTIDLSNNNLSGEIPHFSTHQEASAFANNAMLCGLPLEVACEKNVTGSNVASDKKGRKELEVVDIVLIVVAHVILFACLTIGAVYVIKKRRDSRKCGCPWRRMSNGTRSQASASHCSCIQADEEGESIEEEVMGSDDEDLGGGREGELVAIDKEFRFDIDELFRASAYVLGMNARGIVYKVVVGNGFPVVVRRLGSGSGNGQGAYKEFAADAMAIGRVKHLNVVRVKAFYWTCDEKLLITDFISNGNLASALHGRSGKPPRSLPWSARLKIAEGTAAGLAYIHECSPRKFMHQRIKPTNILLDHDLNPYISDFGLNRLIAVSFPTHQPPLETNESRSYAAPESLIASNRPTQKWDVYSFGVVLLQMLTGRNPEVVQISSEDLSLVKWVRKGLKQGNRISSVIDPMLFNEVPFQKDAMVVLQLALECTDDDPELRPKMKVVSENLQRIPMGT